MDRITTTTPRQASARRDPGSARRAYLDTYASATRAQTPAPAIVDEYLVAKNIQTTSAAHLAMTNAAVLDSSVVPQTQPPVIAEAPQNQTSINTEVKSAQSRRAYLDTLSRRHMQAASQAPQLEETVLQPTISPDVVELFDEPETRADDRVEANLKALYGDYSLTKQLAMNDQSASAAHVRTIVASSLACGILALGIFGMLGRYSSAPVVAHPTDSPVIEVDASHSSAPRGGSAKSLADIPQADASHPTRMLIGALGVNAPVQSLGTTPEGLIDVPKSYGVVGWYNKSTVPGKAGPAVLVGHYTGGNNGVFDNLKNLKGGELITVSNGKGQTFTYKVTAQNEYEKDAVPMAEIFRSSDDSKLQIITCAGKWQSKTYTKRLVITAEIVK